MKETVEITRKAPKRQDIMTANRDGVYTVGGRMTVNRRLRGPVISMAIFQ